MTESKLISLQHFERGPKADNAATDGEEREPLWAREVTHGVDNVQTGSRFAVSIAFAARGLGFSFFVCVAKKKIP